MRLDRQSERAEGAPVLWSRGSDADREIVGHGDYEAGKPAPDPFLIVAQRLGIEPRQCLALEDSHNGVRSAAAAGMMTVMVPDLLEATDEIRGLCTLVADELHEVRSLILAASKNAKLANSAPSA